MGKQLVNLLQVSGQTGYAFNRLIISQQVLYDNATALLKMATRNLSLAHVLKWRRRLETSQYANDQDQIYELGLRMVAGAHGRAALRRGIICICPIRH